MSALQFLFVVGVLALFLPEHQAQAEPIRGSDNGSSSNNNNNNKNVNTITGNDYNTCEDQLNKYRRFLLQAIISFEDVCDAYLSRPPQTLMADNSYRNPDNGFVQFVRSYQPPEARNEIWAFFKLLMAQFNDVEFANVIHDAVIRRCRIKSQLQQEEKRNSVVLGKKQRFHSWGGKRSQLLYPNDNNFADIPLDDYFLWKKQTPKYYDNI